MNKPGLPIKAGLLVVIYGALVLSVNLGGSRVLTYHETLFAQPAREMLASGDWVVPRFAGVPSVHKPPLTHWVLAGSMALFHSQEEWVARLPMVVSALLLSLLVADLAARWHGGAVGLVAGLMQTSVFYVLMQARLAESDMLLALWVTGAMVAFALATVIDHIHRRTWYLLHLAYVVCTILTFLTKGPIGPAFVIGSVGIFACWTRRGWWFLFHPLGLVLLLMGVTAWPVAAYWSYPEILDGWRLHHLDRFTGQMGGAKPFWFYFYIAPLIALPWTPFAVWGGWFARRFGWWQRDEWKLLVCWFGVGFVLLSMSAWKHKHYLIPLMPPLTILAAVGLCDFTRRRNDKKRLSNENRHQSKVTSEESFRQVADTSPSAHTTPPAVPMPVSAPAGVPGAPLFGLVALGAMIVHIAVMPMFDSYRDQTELARAVNALTETAHDTPLWLVNLPENQITYYLNGAWQRLDSLPLALELWRKSTESSSRSEHSSAAIAYVIGPRALEESLTRVAICERVAECATIRKIMVENERITCWRLSAWVPRPLADLPSHEAARR